MVPVGRALVGGLAALVVLLASLAGTIGLAPAAWSAGFGCGVLITVAVARCFPRARGDQLGPADLVTLSRALIACAVAALVVEAWLGSPVTAPLVALSGVALALDAVDGRVARATGRSTDFGARFDGEADAFLLLVLSVHVAPSHGAWVLGIGVARYAFWAAGRVWPWFRRRLPRRDWRKVVTAVQGIVLVVVAANVAPRGVSSLALVIALILLGESFGRDVGWLVRHRHDATLDEAPASALGGRVRAP